MQRYIIRRLLLFIPSLLLASIIMFSILRVIPGDVATAMLGGGESGGYSEAQLQKVREMLGLSDPLIVQYLKWMKEVLTGSLGHSVYTGQPVVEIVAADLPTTVQLSLYVVALSVLVSIPLGVLAALLHNRWPDYAIRSITILGLAMPNFWVALLVIMFLVLVFNWVPPLIYRHLWQSPGDHLSLMVWPALVLAWGYSSYLVRMTRASLLEVLTQDYIRTAHSKGLPAARVIINHALRNALIPVVTLGGLYVGTILSGSVILEVIFGIPGIGSELVLAVEHRDYPIVQALGLLFVTVMLTMNLVVDITYSWLDPRIKYN